MPVNTSPRIQHWQNNAWFNQGFDNVDIKQIKSEDALKRIIHNSVFNDSFASCILQTFPQTKSTENNKLPVELLEDFWKFLVDSLNEQIDIEFNNSPIWQYMREDGTVFSDALRMPTKRRGKENFDINTLAVIDVMLVISKLSSDTKRIKYLKSIGLISKSNYSKSQLKEALFSTDLFSLIFKEEPDLLPRAKELI